MHPAQSFFLEDLYLNYLSVIHNIPFTRREIDIMACLLGARKTSKIAYFLSISPRTVETHIRNITLKLECNTREGIIDFLEASSKLASLRKHYFFLQIEFEFARSLKDISKLSSRDELIYSIVDEKNQNPTVPRLSILKTHLKLAGATLQNRDTKEKGYLLYFLPFNIHNISSSFIQMLQHYPKNKLLLLLAEGQKKQDLPKQLKEFDCISPENYQNYYFYFFAVIKFFFSNNIKIEYIFSQFEKKFETTHAIIKSEYSQYLINGKKKKILFFQKMRYHLSINILRYVTMLLIGFIVLSFLTPYWNLKYEPLKHPIKLTTIPIQLRSAIVDHLELIVGEENQLKNNRSIQKIVWNLPKQDHVFVGRENLLEELDNILHNNKEFKKVFSEKNPTNNLAISACAGLGGIGKTQLALHYVHHTKHPYFLRAWFPAENLNQLQQKYIEFSKVLGYAEEKPTPKLALAYVKQWLENHPGWLLVYDNVGTYKEIEPFLPNRGGHVILTTRQRYWPTKFKVLSIDLMNEEEAISLVKSLLERNLEIKEKNSIKKLVKILGYLPLALAQAATYIQQNKITIGDYLEIYKNYEQALLAENTLPEGTNSLPVTVVWKISIEAIQKEAEVDHEKLLVHELLTICSYLASEKIPRELLLIWLKKAYPQLPFPEIFLNKQLRRLWRYSLINLDKNNFLFIHRLVQAVVRNQHKEISKNTQTMFIQAWYKLFLEAAHLYFIKKTKTLEDETRKKSLLPHFQALVEHCNFKSPMNQSILLALSYVLEDIAIIFHYHMGDAYSAKSYYERALAIKENYYGKRHIKIAEILTYLGDTYGSLGNPLQQKKLLERSLLISEHYYGKTHPSLVLTLESLGAAYWALGEAKKAKLILKRGLEIGEQHYGKQSIEIANTLYYLGNAYGDLGEAYEQKKNLERSLIITEKHYGKGHPLTAFILENLGIANRMIGKINESKEFLEKALSIQERYYGSDHVEVGETLSNLSNVYLALGNAEDAKKLLNRALTILERYYGKRHVYVARALHYLGEVHLNTGAPKQAKEILEHVLAIKKKYYGENHISTAKTLASLGDAYRCLGFPKQAREFLEHALTIRKDYYGRNHVETARTLNSIGIIYALNNQAKLAEDYLQEAFKIFQRNNHPEIYTSLEALSELYLKKSAQSIQQSIIFKTQAIIYLKDALKIMYVQLPEDSSHIKRIESKLNTIEKIK